MNARESDPMHDDYNMTQEQFEQAATMNFPLITIPDPAAVGAWLDQEQPDISGPARPTYGINGWCLVYWTGETHIVPIGATPLVPRFGGHQRRTQHRQQQQKSRQPGRENH